MILSFLWVILILVGYSLYLYRLAIAYTNSRGRYLEGRIEELEETVKVLTDRVYQLQTESK